MDGPISAEFKRNFWDQPIIEARNDATKLTSSRDILSDDPNTGELMA